MSTNKKVRNREISTLLTILSGSRHFFFFFWLQVRYCAATFLISLKVQIRPAIFILGKYKFSMTSNDVLGVSTILTFNRRITSSFCLFFFISTRARQTYIYIEYLLLILVVTEHLHHFTLLIFWPTTNSKIYSASLINERFFCCHFFTPNAQNFLKCPQFTFLLFSFSSTQTG